MSLRFILGRAGTGKTTRCLEEMRGALRESPRGCPLIFLVPEQATFQTEAALASTPGLGGVMRAQVLSFRRLAWRVLREVGGASRGHIGELGKLMVLRELLEKNRTRLNTFHRAAGQPGFAASLAGAIAELKLYCISPGQLRQSLPGLDRGSEKTSLAGKLHDLCLLYEEFQAFLAGRYTDPDDYLNLLAEKAPDSPTLCGAEIWLDGFTGFTPQEYGVLDKIMTVAGRLHVALCLDGRRLETPLREDDLFHPARETLAKLAGLARKNRIKVERPLLLDDAVPRRFREVPDIAHLEDQFFRRPTRPYQGPVTRVKLVAGVNRRAEVESVAREITGLCRDRGYRWRDTVVVLRDLEAYHQLLATVFADHGIPFFIDVKRTVLHHPLVELIRSALEAVTGGWSYDPVFRYLKTDLVRVSREETDTLENYVLAFGIRGARWVDDREWSYRRRLTLAGDDAGEQDEYLLEEVNRIRRGAVAELAAFDGALKAAPDVRGMARAVFNLLSSLDVAVRLEEWSRAAEAGGELEEARRHRQIWGAVLELLDQIVEAMGQDAMSPGAFARVLEAGFEGMRLGLIPPGLDQVIVGSLERSRSPHVRAAFVLGAGDGVLPARVREDGIFNDAERERLQELGIELAPGGRRRLFDENYLVYIALTRAADFLWVSYPLSDDEGRALAPSRVVARLRELLPGLAESLHPVEPGGTDLDPEYVTNPGRCLSYLASMVREFGRGRAVHPVWWDVYNWFLVSSDRRDRLGRVLAGNYFVNGEEDLDLSTGRSLYGSPLRVSVSRVERFKACPFAHFLTHGLRLKERVIHKLGAPDLGQFYHEALKRFAETLREKGRDWGSLTRRDCAGLAGQVVEDIAPLLQNEILLSTARHRYLIKKLKRTVERSTLALAEHARRGRFRPVGLELDFGTGAGLAPLVYDLPGYGKMELAGRIDRVDLARAEEGSYLRVIDYKSGSVGKSGSAGVSLTEIYHGIKLQLLTYLHVVLSQSQRLTGEACQPAGMLYFGVTDPVLRAPGPLSPEEAEAEMLRALKMKGMVLADGQVVKMMDALVQGQSDLLPVGIKKDGEFYSTSAVLDREKFQLLRLYLDRLLLEAGAAMAGGSVKIQPYRMANRWACQFCAYKPVCQFDQSMEGNAYRIIGAEAGADIWHKLKAAVDPRGGFSHA